MLADFILAAWSNRKGGGEDVTRINVVKSWLQKSSYDKKVVTVWSIGIGICAAALGWTFIFQSLCIMRRQEGDVVFSLCPLESVCVLGSYS